MEKYIKLQSPTSPAFFRYMHFSKNDHFSFKIQFALDRSIVSCEIERRRSPDNSFYVSADNYNPQHPDNITKEEFEAMLTEVVKFLQRP
jgi:hypothetical protein